MADKTVPIYRATVYPMKILLAPAVSAGCAAMIWYMLFIACAAIKPLNSYIIFPLIMIPVTHGALIGLTFLEPHFDTLLVTIPQKNVINWKLKLLGKKQRKKIIFYPS